MLAARPSGSTSCSDASRRPRRPFSPVLAFLLLGACQRVPLGDGDSAGESGPDDTDSDTDGEPTTGPIEPPPDFEPVYDCEPAGGALACPMGQKCSAVSDGGLQNHFKCVPDDGELPAYEACVPAPENGQDQCGSGTVCLAYTEQDLSSGRCLPVCRNDSDCEPGLCTISPFSGTTFCADGCDPAAPDCFPGFGCRQARDRYICEMVLEEDIGLVGEACSESTYRGCADTYACLPGALIPNCASSGCCTTTCDLLGGPDQCPSPTLCYGLFTEPAPGFEDVGACFVPA